MTSDKAQVDKCGHIPSQSNWNDFGDISEWKDLKNAPVDIMSAIKPELGVRGEQTKEFQLTQHQLE